MSTLPEHLEQRLWQLLEIPSPSGAEGQLADFLQARMRVVKGAELQRVGDNLIVTLKADPERPRVLLCGHLDTVPEQGNQQPRKDGDRIYGLGASDLKAGLAALWHLAESPEFCDFAVTPVLVFYTCEEVAFSRSGLNDALAAAPWLRQLDFAVCVEPTANVVELGCLGTLHAEITVPGVAAHSARPWLGKNAIHAALPLLQRLAGIPERSFVDPRDPRLRFREVLHVTQIEGGHARNVLPRLLRFLVNFRYAPDRSAEQAESMISDLVGEGATVEFVDHAPAGASASESPFCAGLIQSAGGQRRAKQAWTDVGRFSQWGLPAVSFGPGLPEKAHQQDEYASLDLLCEYWRILQRWCRQPTPGRA